MNILRISTLSLTVAIAVFALGYNTSFADKPTCGNQHCNHGDDDPVPTIEPCGVDLCIASVGKWHRPPAREYVEQQFGEAGNYTAMTSSRFGEILGTLEEGQPADDLCAAFDVVIVEWSSPKIKNWNWPRVLDYMACGGGIIFEDPKNVGALAAGVSTIELDLSGSGGPLFVTLQPVCVLTVGEPLNSESCGDALPGPFNLEVVNQHIIFDETQPIPGEFLMPFLRTMGLEQLVGLYGEFPGGPGSGRIVLSGLDSNYHGLLESNAPNNAKGMENSYNLLWNEINWLLAAP